MTSSNQSQETIQTSENIADSSAQSPENNSMAEYYQLKQNLLLVTITLTGIIFGSVWVTYSLNTALNYLIGGGVGMVYLRMLAKEVERLGNQKRRLGSTRLALFVGIIIVASQVQELEILPIFLGFMTYKAAIIFYVLQTTLRPTQK